MMRATESVPPPGENGTTMRIGLVGNFCCGCATADMAARAEADEDRKQA
jgi:hypothetical protein